MDFLKEYQGHLFQDDGPYCSDDFKKFAKRFKAYLQKSLPAKYKIVGHRCGHYDLSGFVKSPDGCVYYSWSWNRFSVVDVNEGAGAMKAVLVRKAKDEKDYHGGYNQFTSMANLPDEIVRLMTSLW